MSGLFGAGTKPRLVVEAVVIKACPHCGASGVDEYQTPIGNVCPKCNGLRNPDENRGVIYDTRWFVGWGRFKRKFKKWLGRI